MLRSIIPPIQCPTCKKEFVPKTMNQKYCSIECREKTYEKLRKEYYIENRDKIRKRQKKYREEKKQELMRNMKKYAFPLYICKFSTNMFNFHNPIKHYNYNEDYGLWTIVTFDGDLFLIYSKNIKYLTITVYDEDDDKKIVATCKKGETEIRELKYNE